MKAMTVGEYIDTIDCKSIVSLKNEYGVFYTGRAEFVLRALRFETLIKDVKNCGFEIIVH